MRKMDYGEALGKLKGLTKFGINLGLERITCLLAQLGNPQDKIQCIHIGGTNGKGSVVAILGSVLQAAGYKVGAFTSPHLESYTERYVINGTPQNEESLTYYLAKVLDHYEAVQQEIGEAPTEFEVLTAMAFLYFAAENVDVLLLEVGLGGDIDSTNVIAKPLLSIITNVTLDHCAYLGDTSSDIAAKKGGIIKNGCPVITASDDEDVLLVLRRIAQDKNATLHEVYQDARWELLQDNIDGQYFSLSNPYKKRQRLFLPLQGVHQLGNAATAITAIDVLNTMGWQISEASLADGLAKVKWPGRLEKISDKPAIYLDGAHNPAGIEALAGWLQNVRKRYSRIILVIGMLDDKDKSAVSLLAPWVDQAIITKPPSDRASRWDDLADFFRKQNKIPLLVIEPGEAIEKACALAKPTDLIIVSGSLYLIGQIRQDL